MATTRDPMLDTAVRHQVYLERVGSHLSSEAQKKLDKLDEEISSIVAKLGEGNLNEITRKQLRDILAEVAEAQELAQAAVLDYLMPQLEAVTAYETEFEAKNLQQGVRDVKVATAKAYKAYKRALEDPLPATGDKLESFLGDWSAKEKKSVSQLISRGFVNGWTNQQLRQAITGTKKLDYKDGLLKRMDRNVDAIVRTSVMHVASTARFETWANNADIITGYQIVATLDGGTTEICRSLDHQVFLLNEGPRPPFHIKCRTTTIARIAAKYAFLKEGATRSSLTGQVSAKDSYYDWLKDQPIKFQEDVLGPTRAKLLNEGGLTAEQFASMSLGKNFQPLTLEQMRKLEPRAFERAGL